MRDPREHVISGLGTRSRRRDTRAILELAALRRRPAGHPLAVVRRHRAGAVTRRSQPRSRRRSSAGIVVVASAGNSGTCRAAVPGGYDGVIAVGAVGPDGPTPWTNYGEWVDACAPGADLVSAFFADFDGPEPRVNTFDPDRFEGLGDLERHVFRRPVVVAALAREMVLGNMHAQRRPPTASSHAPGALGSAASARSSPPERPGRVLGSGTAEARGPQARYLVEGRCHGAIPSSARPLRRRRWASGSGQGPWSCSASQRWLAGHRISSGGPTRRSRASSERHCLRSEPTRSDSSDLIGPPPAVQIDPRSRYWIECLARAWLGSWLGRTPYAPGPTRPRRFFMPALEEPWAGVAGARFVSRYDAGIVERLRLAPD